MPPRFARADDPPEIIDRASVSPGKPGTMDSPGTSGTSGKVPSSSVPTPSATGSTPTADVIETPDSASDSPIRLDPPSRPDTAFESLGGLGAAKLPEDAKDPSRLTPRGGFVVHAGWLVPHARVRALVGAASQWGLAIRAPLSSPERSFGVTFEADVRASRLERGLAPKGDAIGPDARASARYFDLGFLLGFEWVPSREHVPLGVLISAGPALQYRRLYLDLDSTSVSDVAVSEVVGGWGASIDAIARVPLAGTTLIIRPGAGLSSGSAVKANLKDYGGGEVDLNAPHWDAHLRLGLAF